MTGVQTCALPIYSLRRPVNAVLERIQETLRIDKHISVCFYISEKALIQGLVEYFKAINAEDMREVYSRGQMVKPMLSNPIAELTSFAKK